MRLANLQSIRILISTPKQLLDKLNSNSKRKLISQKQIPTSKWNLFKFIKMYKFIKYTFLEIK